MLINWESQGRKSELVNLWCHLKHMQKNLKSLRNFSTLNLRKHTVARWVTHGHSAQIDLVHDKSFLDESWWFFIPCVRIWVCLTWRPLKWRFDAHWMNWRPFANISLFHPKKFTSGKSGWVVVGLMRIMPAQLKF